MVGEWNLDQLVWVYEFKKVSFISIEGELNEHTLHGVNYRDLRD